MDEEKVILVDTNDNPIGMMPKMEAHEKALLHRAFSVFILNQNGELLLQQRALHKYHSPGLWTNTCCSHQRKGETNVFAGKRRLKEEMGFSTSLKELFSFIYIKPLQIINKISVFTIFIKINWIYYPMICPLYVLQFYSHQKV